MAARRGTRSARRAGWLAAALVVAGLATPGAAQPAPGDGAASGGATDGGESKVIASYFSELAKQGLIDATSGTLATLRQEVGEAEHLLQAGNPVDAAIALYGVVESPRYADFTDAIEYANAEYYLGVALAGAGAFDSALEYLARVVARGPGTLYFSPAHRRMVDIALETNDYAGVLAQLEAIQLSEPLPVEASGERGYLRARAAVAAGKDDEAEGELSQISRKSRLYTSALYLRGVIRTRHGEFKDAAAALCEIVDTPDDDKFNFVIDDRYFTIRDLAHLGLGRLAHEVGDYDDAYYHYFQIPDDSDRLPEALFEAAWSMYQKRELGTARDLIAEFLHDFPSSPLMPEGRLLAGYVELADCKFDDAQHYYDRLVADLQPVVDRIDRIRKDTDQRSLLYDRALVKWQVERAEPGKRVDFAIKSPTDQVLALLRLDPEFVRLHEAMAGLRRASGQAMHTTGLWSGLLGRLSESPVAGVVTPSAEADDAAGAHGLVDDVRHLGEQIARAQDQLRAGVRNQTVAADVAKEEGEHLAELARQAADLEGRATGAADAADAALGDKAPPGLKGLVTADIERSRQLARAAAELYGRLTLTADEIARRSLDKLYDDTRQVLDKAKLGKIDAVIGQKRRLEIEVQDLSAGRFPAELTGQMWEQGLIGDDEEYWPFEGEFWADEYEGWR